MNYQFIPEVEKKLKIFRALQELITFKEGIKFSQISTADECDFHRRDRVQRSATLVMFVRSPEVKYNHEISVDLDTDMEEEINRFLHEVFVRVGNIDEIKFDQMKALYKACKFDYEKFEKGQFNRDFKKVLMAKELLK